MNTLRVGFLLVALTAVFVWVGGLIGGQAGVVIAFGLAVAMNLGSYWFSDKLVVKMTGAQPVAPGSAPRLERMIERLSEKAGIPTPALYIVPDPQPNAFATGRNPERAVVAVNQGLLDLLDERELEGVVAHELAHVKHRDTLTMAIVATLAGAVMTLASIARWGMIFGGLSRDEEGGGGALGLLVASIVAPIAAVLIQMGISRAREFEADRAAAELTGSPQGLMSALARLERGAELVPETVATPSTAHLRIVNPLRGGSAMSALGGLFRTHPPTEKRIEALRALEGRV
jgi:heat shock protein HtpX